MINIGGFHMKVLLCTREDYKKNFAGDSKIVLKTAKYLIKHGVEVQINIGDITDYSPYDIVHLFNLSRTGEIYKYYRDAHRYKKNIVITPIYWDLTKYYEQNKEFENLRLWEKCMPYREEVLKGSKMIFPNSETEKNIIISRYGQRLPFKIIYNGVEVEHDETPLYNLKDRYNLNNYVLSVGRINPQKNQLGLAKACSELGVNLVLIGVVNDRAYLEQCKAYKNVLYLGFIDSYNIYNAYRFAKLHVLPSFVEASGLTSLEAAACGCNIVSTLEGSSKEYFRDYALFCDPYDERSIIEAVEKGYNKRKDSRLKNYVISNYSWENSIKELYESYKKILSE